MKRVASLVSGLVVVSGALAGCGGDGGGAVSVNSSWRLWAAGAQSFTLHTLSGRNGYDDNKIECSSDGSNISIRMVDAAKVIDENEDGIPDVDSGNPGIIDIQARVNDPSICRVQAFERARGTTAPEPPRYTDACGLDGSCQISLTVNGGSISGTVFCSEMTQDAGGNPLVLGSVERTMPMRIELENCGT